MDIHVEMQVWAEYEDQAQTIARQNVDEELVLHDDAYTIRPTTSLTAKWRDAYPWGDEVTQTCGELLAEASA